MSYDSKAPQGAVTDLAPQLAALQATASPAPTAGIPAPAGGGQPGEGIGSGQPVMAKSYVGSVAGQFNDLGAQLPDLQAATQPPPAERRDFVVARPEITTQPGENIGGGDGDMVTASPSSSGAGAMVPGVGQRV